MHGTSLPLSSDVLTKRVFKKICQELTHKNKTNVLSWLYMNMTNGGNVFYEGKSDCKSHLFILLEKI